MANLFNKMKEMMFGEYDDGYEDAYDDYEKEYTELPASQKEPAYGNLRDVSANREREREPEYAASPRKATTRNTSNVSSITASVQMQVVIIKPECYEDAQEICDQIKTKRPVVVNLERVEYPIAQRIMDFLSGTCYSLEGSIQRVANNIFIIAPENVDISGDFKEELKTKGVIFPWASNAAR